ncbi:type II toxin-antitoxin system RelE/ParE family toxin [Candidatus Acetothermia bacterium]|nr:type II toxin-antitoxin system RelE/ParE family toxin [Candidatus Acetothermia bacterium]MBI3642634.1 type II toxin-antitoxin system RelE/ParE family toxin [Candidatus Acetothermia bacterium]
MIVGFKDRRLKRFYEKGDRRQLSPELVDRIETILGRLDTAKEIYDMGIHSYRLHALAGELEGFWAVIVRANWRIIFRFEDENAFDVALIDYH